jgi:carotenoid cleavage dioxygenase-like enzyme
MTQAYPDHPNLNGNYAPLRMECEVNDLIVEGEVPQDLYGSFYRNGPDPQFPPLGQYHWFGGDGMVHAFHFENGKVSYLNRWSRTSKWKQERKAGKSLIDGLNPMKSDPQWDPEGEDGTANTNIMFHAGKLLALEEGHVPFELDPTTLESKGAYNYGGKLRSPMTAHPKIDPVSGDMYGFSYTANNFFSSTMSYFVINSKGELKTYEEFEAPFASMVHDFMVTDQHIIFPIFPLTIDFDRVMKGNSPIAWDPDKGTHVGVMPRHGNVQDIQWFNNDARYVFHVMNAYTKDGKIVADVMQFGEAPLFPRADGTKGDSEGAEARLNRWEIDLESNSKSFKSDYLDEDMGEFPRLDERFSMREYRHGYYASGIGEHPNGYSFNSVVHHDHVKKSKAAYTLGKHDSVGEPVFVPKNKNSEEGDGFLLIIAHRGIENRSDLLILDATNVADGPVATIKLPHRIPHGFHGNWRQGS